jgi:hypothetical protein
MTDQTGAMITLIGVLSLSFILMYLFEERSPMFVLAFAAGCGLSSSYGFLSGAWPFGVVEGVWRRGSHSTVGSWSDPAHQGRGRR